MGSGAGNLPRSLLMLSTSITLSPWPDYPVRRSLDGRQANVTPALLNCHPPR
jgi:hypothetical protein